MVTVKLQEINRTLYAAIPRWFCAKLNLIKGDILVVALDGETLQLHPIQPHTIGPTPSGRAPDRNEAREEDRGQ